MGDGLLLKSAMGSLSQSSQSPRPAGEVLKWKYNQYIIRILILLGTATSVAFLLFAWTQPLGLQSFRTFGLACPPQNRTRHEDPQQDKAEVAMVKGNNATSMLKGNNATSMVKGNNATSLSMDRIQKRGVGLLHAWTDSELLLRAVQSEIFEAGQQISPSRTPKIAFMFLIQKDLPFAPLWNRFFKGHEGLYNVYVHLWPLRLSTFPKSKGVFWGRLIPSQEGKRLTPGLIGDARRLLANALLDDPANEWFALISESCVPIHGFQHVYKTLASTNKSFVDSGPRHWDMQNRYKARGDNAMKPEIQFSQFRVGSQFWVLRRRHAVMIVGDHKYWRKFNRPCLPQYRNCFPEEHYFATLMNILDPNGWSHTATLVDWSKMEPGGHPRRFRASEVNERFIRDLQAKADGELLFARKFGQDCLDPLLENAKVILEH